MPLTILFLLEYKIWRALQSSDVLTFSLIEAQSVEGFPENTLNCFNIGIIGGTLENYCAGIPIYWTFDEFNRIKAITKIIHSIQNLLKRW